jgi:hypothetical protein
MSIDRILPSNRHQFGPDCPRGAYDEKGAGKFGGLPNFDLRNGQRRVSTNTEREALRE